MKIIVQQCSRKQNVEKNVEKEEKTREARTKRYKESLVALSRCLDPGRTSEMPAEKKKDKQRKVSSHLVASLSFTNMIFRNRRLKRLASIKFRIYVVSNGKSVLEQIAGQIVFVNCELRRSYCTTECNDLPNLRKQVSQVPLIAVGETTRARVPSTIIRYFLNIGITKWCSLVFLFEMPDLSSCRHS